MKLQAALGALVILVSACSSGTSGTGTGTSGSPRTAPTSPTTPPVTTPATSVASTAPVRTTPTRTTTTPAPPITSTTPAGPATARLVARPVTAAGAPAPGWTVHDGTTTIECSDVAGPSPAAVDDGIAYCSPSAAFAIACWRADAGHALCAIDLAKHVLLRYEVDGGFHSPTRPAHPAPFAMTLAGGSTCTIRDGGTGFNLTDHPDWVVYYYCSGNTAVYAPRDGTGVDMTSPQWTVHVGSTRGEGDVHTVAVTTATFVGTAGG